MPWLVSGILGERRLITKEKLFLGEGKRVSRVFFFKYPIKNKTDFYGKVYRVSSNEPPKIADMAEGESTDSCSTTSDSPTTDKTDDESVATNPTAAAPPDASRADTQSADRLLSLDDNSDASSIAAAVAVVDDATRRTTRTTNGLDMAL